MDPASESVLRAVIDSVLADAVLHPTERAFVAAKGVEIGVGEEAALALLDQEVRRRGNISIVAPSEDSGHPEAVHLYLNRGRSLQLGHSGVLECALVNAGTERVEQVRLEVSSKPPQDDPLEGMSRRALDAGERAQHPFFIVPKLAGENLVRIKLSYRDQLGVHGYQAYARVHVESPAALGNRRSSVNVTIRASKMMGVDASHLVSGLPLDASDSTARAADLAAEASPRWERVPLERDPDLVAETPPKAVPQRAEPVPAAPEMGIAARLIAAGGMTSQHVVKLVTRRIARFGRSGDLNDIALVYLPPSRDHQRLSDSIAREHCLVERLGDELVLRNLSSLGTWVNGSPVAVGGTASVPDRAEFVLGAAHFRLDIAAFREGEGRRLLAVRLRRLDNMPQHEYYLLAGAVRVGRAPSECLMINHPSVSDTHAEIDAAHGQFRVADLGSARGTFVDGRRLTPGEPCSLSDGAQVVFGEVAYAFQTVS